MNLKVANAKCYEHQGAYLWVWQDYAGAWQARAAFRYEEKRCTRPLRTWGDVRVFLADLSASYLSLELPEHAEGLRQLSLAVLETYVRSDQPLDQTLVSWDGLKSLPCLGVVADDNSEAHLYQDGDRWRLWGENGGSGLAFRAGGADPVRLLARLADSGAGLPPALLRQLLLALGPQEAIEEPALVRAKPAAARCLEHQGAYLWVWQDYAGAWQARAGGVAPKHLRTSQVKTWGDVEVLLIETAKSFVSLDDSHSLAVRRLALAVRNSWLSRTQSVGIGLSPSDLVAAGVTTPAYVAIVAKGGSYAHLWREPGGWRARIATPTWVHESDSELTAGHAVRALWSRTGGDPSWLPERVLVGELGRAARANGLDEEATVSPPAVEQPPEPLPAPRPLPTNLAERFGALVADLLAEGGAHEELGHQLLCLTAGEDLPREPAETRQEGWWQDCERDARDAFADWITCWQPGVLAPQFGGMDISPDWGWQTAGRPHVWWGESSDDAEGAALAESARLGRPHRLVRVVAQTELAPRGHWRMRPVGGEE